MNGSTYLSSREAAEQLGVSAATLYAYVSRGMIRSEATGEKSRARRYSAEDVARLRERKEVRRNPARAAREALHWGAPLLESGLTLITGEGLYYRGFDALATAVTASLEETAALLWLDDAGAARELFAPAAADPLIPRTLARLRPLVESTTPMQRLSIALALAGRDDIAAFDLSPERTPRTGARLLRLVADVAAGRSDPTLDITGLVAAGWGCGSPGAARLASAARLIGAALVLCADHELNVSAFAARVVASAEAQLYFVVAAGLAALQGIRHGGSTERAEALLREALGGNGAEEIIAARLRRGEIIPGFGLRPYPAGDPRARLLLSLAREGVRGSPIIAAADRMAAVMRQTTGLAPNLDFSLGVLSLALELPPGAALALFAIGRTVGWIGHAIEQYRDRRIIRPRATYTGPPPRAPRPSAG